MMPTLPARLVRLLAAAILCAAAHAGAYADTAATVALPTAPSATTALPVPIANAAATVSPAPATCNFLKDLAFVAHQDDDLLFMNPDLRDGIAAGGCLRMVYLTASDRGEGNPYMLGRERGVRAAYAYMAGVPDQWREDSVVVGHHHIARFTLQGNPRVELWHLRLQDPWLGRGWGSLTPLSQTESVSGAVVETLGDYREQYTRADLVATLAAIIQAYQPTSVRHLDDTISVPYTQLCWRCAGHDHPDHIASARLVRDAMLLAPGTYAEIGYVNYPTQERTANLSNSETSLKADVFRHYAWNDYRYCARADTCNEPAGPAAAWVGRTYFVSRRNTPPAALLDAQGGLLLAAPGEYNNAVNIWQGGTMGWHALGGRTASPVLAVAGTGGQAGLISRDTLGHLWYNHQLAGTAWSGWQPLGGRRTPHLPAQTAAGAPALLLLANDGLYYWAALPSHTHTWSSWQPLPPLPGATRYTALLREPSGGLRAFAADSQGRLYTLAWHNTTAGAVWQHVAAPAIQGDMAVIRDGAGDVELYLRKRDDGHLLRMTGRYRNPAAPRIIPAMLANHQGAIAAPALGAAAAHLTPSAPSLPRRADTLDWLGTSDLGIVFSGPPAIALNSAGNVMVATLETPGGALWLTEAGQPQRLPAIAASPPALLTSNAGTYIIARATGPTQHYEMLMRQHDAWRPSATASPLAFGGGAYRSTPVGTQHAPAAIATPLSVPTHTVSLNIGNASAHAAP